MATFADPFLNEYINNNSFEKRRAVTTQLLREYSDRIPIIVGRAELTRTPEINKQKFLVPGNMVFGKFVEDVRVHIASLDSRTALFFFLSDNTLPPISIMMATLYEKHKSPDGFLYITYSCENTFG